MKVSLCCPGSYGARCVLCLFCLDLLVKVSVYVCRGNIIPIKAAHTHLPNTIPNQLLSMFVIFYFSPIPVLI